MEPASQSGSGPAYASSIDNRCDTRNREFLPPRIQFTTAFAPSHAGDILVQDLNSQPEPLSSGALLRTWIVGNPVNSACFRQLQTRAGIVIIARANQWAKAEIGADGKLRTGAVRRAYTRLRMC